MIGLQIDQTRHFSHLMSDLADVGESIQFFKAIKKNKREETKVYFTASKIFLVKMKDNQQIGFEVRDRPIMPSLIGAMSDLEH